MAIRRQARQECLEASEIRLGSPERTVKAHECAGSLWEYEMIRYSLETRRVQDKEPTQNIMGHNTFSAQQHQQQPQQTRGYSV
jgi:hypothetical protein